jgi:hypothetical protein
MTSGQAVNHEGRSIPLLPVSRTIVVQNNLIAVLENDPMLLGSFVYASISQKHSCQRLQMPRGQKPMRAEFA